MAIIQPPVDTVGTHKLKQQNKLKNTQASVQQATDSTERQNQEKYQRFRRQSGNSLRRRLNDEPPVSATPEEERRKIDRRKRNIPVLLDTRSKHDRRHTSATGLSDETSPQQYGIDTSA